MRVTNLLFSAVKCLQLQGGFAPPDPLGAPPPDPHIGSRSRARHILSVPVLFLQETNPGPTLSFAVTLTCLHQNGQNLAHKKRNSELQNAPSHPQCWQVACRISWRNIASTGCFRSSEKLVAVPDVSQLKQHLVDTWSSLSQDVIDDAIDQWRVRLRACVKAKGRHFEYLL